MNSTFGLTTASAAAVAPALAGVVSVIRRIHAGECADLCRLSHRKMPNTIIAAASAATGITNASAAWRH